MTGFIAIYLSFMTLMAVGYGDITPVADVARMLAMIEAMAGTFFVGIMIARLVSLYSTFRQNAPTSEDREKENYCRSSLKN